MVAPSSDSNKEKQTSQKDHSDTSSVASEVGKSKSTDKKSESKRIKLLNTQMSENIIKCIEEECEKISKDEEASKIADKIYKMLEKKFPKGWCVFAGKHFFGLCVHESNHCLEFEIDDIRVCVFKTYLPNGKDR